LEETAAEFLDFAHTGKSVVETSHRSPEYDAIHSEAQACLKRLLGLGDDYEVLLVGGGASLQFAAVAMNLLGDGQVADYLVTGSWSKKAVKEAQRVGKVNIAADTGQDGAYTRVPAAEECSLTPGAAYLHLTSNNTIFGTQYQSYPKAEVPLVADMSSDILSRPFDARQFAVIYAGAQKNLGPSGVTVVLVRADILERCNANLPSMVCYPVLAKTKSLHNTPPCFNIYMVGKVLKWIERAGGLDAMGDRTQRKAKLLYDAIERHAGFYRAPVEKESRSAMNVVFRLPSEELEKRFVAEAKTAQMIGLKGHRSVGGIRVSLYNGVEPAWVETLVGFMDEFARTNG
jgi:phosphoserine aminotransferase